ncbi:MAG: beta-propeller fold lactonase family protein [Bryobacteraceae bacterium]|jgi:sugar lactone lactonase YvrE
MSRTALIAAASCAAALGADPSPGSFLVTNDDLAHPFENTATFYAVNADGTLGGKTSVTTGGGGIGGGFFAAARAIALPNGADACVYVSNAWDGDIAAIAAKTRTLTGTFYGSATDSGTTNGIGLAANAQYLYATFTASTTIATFQVQAGCTLSFVGDVFAAGLNGGVVDGMAIHGDIMVITYGDGSIESFDISGGVPVSNGDQQDSTGSSDDHLPNSVAIAQDGHYAVFGDASTRTTVEVSDISSGKLAPTVAYDLGPGWNSGNVRLSPDEKTLFIANDSSGQVTAAFFDSATGKVYPGCTSNTLKGFYTNFQYVGNVGLQLATGAGGAIYVPEFAGGGTILLGIVEFTSTGTACTLAESANSPVSDPAAFAYLLSIAVYPAAP